MTILLHPLRLLAFIRRATAMARALIDNGGKLDVCQAKALLRLIGESK